MVANKSLNPNSKEPLTEIFSQLGHPAKYVIETSMNQEDGCRQFFYCSCHVVNSALPRIRTGTLLSFRVSK